MDNNKLKKQAMGIVNQLYDLAEVQVDKRQQINDKADEYMIEQLLIQRVSNQGELLRNQEEWLIKNTALSGKTIDDFTEHFKQ
jgi:hypothetical protein